MSGPGLKKRGRPTSIARRVAEEAGLSIRTVQRVLADRPKEVESEQDLMLRRFLETFRNFASFCRENSCERVANLSVSEEQAAKIREWNGIVMPWLKQLNGDNDV